MRRIRQVFYFNVVSKKSLGDREGCSPLRDGRKQCILSSSSFFVSYTLMAPVLSLSLPFLINYVCSSHFPPRHSWPFHFLHKKLSLSLVPPCLCLSLTKPESLFVHKSSEKTRDSFSRHNSYPHAAATTLAPHSIPDQRHSLLL